MFPVKRPTASHKPLKRSRSSTGQFERGPPKTLWRMLYMVITKRPGELQNALTGAPLWKRAVVRVFKFVFD